MRILHVFQSYMPSTHGNVEQMIYQLCEASRAHGVQADVFTLSSAPYGKPRQVAAHFVHEAKADARKRFSMAALQGFRALARQYDIIHYHFPWTFGYLLHLMAGHGKPTVVTHHTDPIGETVQNALHYPLMQQFLKTVDCIVTTSPQLWHTSPLLRQHADKSAVIPIGIDPNNCPPVDASRIGYWRKKLPKRFFLFADQLEAHTGLNNLLRAQQNCHYPLVIAGTGPKQKTWQQMAKRLRLKNVYFLGAVSDTDQMVILNMCEALVVPGIRHAGAQDVTLLEAAMLGKPIISCEIGNGTSWVNIHGKTGIMVPPKSSIHLQEALDILWQNPFVSRKLGTEAQRRFHEKLTADRMAERYTNLYTALLGIKRTPLLSYQKSAA